MWRTFSLNKRIGVHGWRKRGESPVENGQWLRRIVAKLVYVARPRPKTIRRSGPHAALESDAG
jgi:hypothetical protein